MLLFGCSDCNHILGSLTFFSSCFWASLLANFFTCSNAALLAALMEFLVLSPSCFIILAMAFTVSAPGLLWTKHQILTSVSSFRHYQVAHAARRKSCTMPRRCLCSQRVCTGSQQTTSLGSAYRCCRYITECVLATHSLLLLSCGGHAAPSGRRVTVLVCTPWYWHKDLLAFHTRIQLQRGVSNGLLNRPQRLHKQCLHHARSHNPSSLSCLG